MSKIWFTYSHANILISLSCWQILSYENVNQNTLYIIRHCFQFKLMLCCQFIQLSMIVKSILTFVLGIDVEYRETKSRTMFRLKNLFCLLSSFYRFKLNSLHKILWFELCSTIIGELDSETGTCFQQFHFIWKWKTSKHILLT